ncbi:AT-hook motif nuclear-localized protein 9-like isoform X2 [Cucurbita maxima]|uniref:AT-hook motif nuclear-localized protein n=1 Tax=Cucurbita maxima TaxID=3661 RepID=A0A6J1K1C1_CUCMA|nr:AT-hook motif nuclear-localized protein 9-like isoform X2 [Cucurbita maxima]
MLALTNPEVQSIREEVFSMEDQNLTAESESLTDLKSTTTEINEATDDEDTSIGNSGIVGERHLEELSSGEVISKKKRRGRPRRKAAIDLEKPSSPSSQGSLSSSANSRNTSKRRRGRPPNSGRLQLLASLGGFAWDTAGGSFTPHILHIPKGEDIVKGLSRFSKKGPRAICIISAVGSVSSVHLRQVDAEPNTTQKFQGMFEILRITGSFVGQMNGKRTKVGQVSISLAHPDGRVFGGVVASALIAATPIQIVVASFKQRIIPAVKRMHTPAHNSQPSGTDEEEVCDAPGTPQH